MYEGYEKEENIAQLDIAILGETPDAEGDYATLSEATAKIKKKAIPMTPRETWIKNNRI